MKYKLKKDIVIKAGTIFDDDAENANFFGYVETAVGIGKDCVEWFKIYDMDEILNHEPSFFEEVK